MTETTSSTDRLRSETGKPLAAPVPSADGKPVSTRPVAVIDIGTTSIRMEIAEIGPDGFVRSLQRLFQAVNLGKDTFTQGSLHKNRVEECVRILKSYRRVLDEYQITQADQIRVVATSAVREADNRLTFLDRIYSATGLQVEPIEPPDVIRITYLGIQPLLRAEATLFAKTTMIVEVGGGSTELLLVHGEDVLTSQTYRLGTVRMQESLQRLRSPQLRAEDIMADHIGHMIEQMQQHITVEAIDQMVALGGDMRFANVIPEAFELNLNYRFAPGRSLEDAQADVRAMVAGRAEVHFTDLAPSGRVCADNPHFMRLREVTGLPATSKQAWTDVARLGEWGVDAVNYGPGETAQAHQASESCDEAALYSAYVQLSRFLSSPL